MRRLMNVLLALFMLIAVLLALLWAMQRRLMYFPDRAMLAPADVGLPDAEPVTFTTSDDVTLHGWFVRAAPAETPAAAPDATPHDAPAGARVAAIVFNGNAGNRAYRARLAAALRARGISVLLFDYRGFGDSAVNAARAHPTEAGLALDARAARAFLLRAEPASSRVIYFGESLGAAVAIELASAHPPDALILRSPFTSMTEMGQLLYPLLPVHRLLRDRYPSIDRVAQLRCPLLVIAGDADRIVPVAQSQRLFDAARDPKQLLILPGVDHNDGAFLDGRAMLDAITRFLATLPPSS